MILHILKSETDHFKLTRGRLTTADFVPYHPHREAFAFRWRTGTSIRSDQTWAATHRTGPKQFQVQSGLTNPFTTPKGTFDRPKHPGFQNRDPFRHPGYPPRHKLVFTKSRVRFHKGSAKKAMSRRYSRKRKYRRGSSYAATLALKKVRRLEKKIEVKTHDRTPATIANVSNTGVVTDLALIAQGDGVGQRDGNYITPFRLQLNVRWAGVAASTTDIYRTIVFRDKRQEATVTPAVLAVLRDNEVISLYNTTTRKRFQILYDEVMTGPGDAAVLHSFALMINLKLYGRMGFQGTASTDINENGLYMLNISNLAANQLSVAYTSRVFFNDS